MLVENLRARECPSHTLPASLTQQSILMLALLAEFEDFVLQPQWTDSRFVRMAASPPWGKQTDVMMTQPRTELPPRSGGDPQQQVQHVWRQSRQPPNNYDTD